LQKLFGEYFFVEMDEKSLAKAIETNFVRNDAIKSDEDICALIAKE
jgi:hypothetical protein